MLFLTSCHSRNEKKTAQNFDNRTVKHIPESSRKKHFFTDKKLSDERSERSLKTTVKG